MPLSANESTSHRLLDARCTRVSWTVLRTPAGRSFCGKKVTNRPQATTPKMPLTPMCSQMRKVENGSSISKSMWMVADSMPRRRMLRMMTR